MIWMADIIFRSGPSRQFRNRSAERSISAKFLCRHDRNVVRQRLAIDLPFGNAEVANIAVPATDDTA